MVLCSHRLRPQYKYPSPPKSHFHKISYIVLYNVFVFHITLKCHKFITQKNLICTPGPNKLCVLKIQNWKEYLVKCWAYQGYGSTLWLFRSWYRPADCPPFCCASNKSAERLGPYPQKSCTERELFIKTRVNSHQLY